MQGMSRAIQLIAARIIGYTDSSVDAVISFCQHCDNPPRTHLFALVEFGYASPSME